MKSMAPELLSQIFLFTSALEKREPGAHSWRLDPDVSRKLSMNDPIVAAVRLSAVCSFWRSTALGCAELWTCIIIDLQSMAYEPYSPEYHRLFSLQDAYVDAIIPRYRQCKTELTLLAGTSVREEHWQHLQRWWNLLAPQARAVHLQAGMWWDHPSLSDVPIPWEETIFALLATPMPHLEHCVLSTDDKVHNMWGLEGLLPQCSSLLTLVLHGLSVRHILNAIGSTNISELVLYEDTELHRLWNLRDKAPTLQRLVLHTTERWAKKLRPPTSLHTLVLHTGAQRQAFDGGLFTGVREPDMDPGWVDNDESMAIRRTHEEDEMEEWTESSNSTDDS
ncbi:hypothetical protein EXIGLDRAFT_706586 [Exidia glandulosa HHB12029]|uniref:F-box domain-containing protein n=1 Tax=Exidia glandulosa HHB12029 TaxID=1314781 RepID=A0A165PMK0_EXIGL|nr:hypothetical protein EXIGLDRAFT_706586 [Exidia glandulosa HHB12029]